MRIELTRVGLLVYLANTTRGAPDLIQVDLYGCVNMHKAAEIIFYTNIPLFPIFVPVIDGLPLFKCHFPVETVFVFFDSSAQDAFSATTDFNNLTNRTPRTAENLNNKLFSIKLNIVCVNV